MEVRDLPLFSELKDSRCLLIAGAGGGFDVFCGLPLYFALREQGRRVYLANYSFSPFYGDVTGRRLASNAVVVTSRSKGPKDYFPEKHLCRWFKKKGEEVSVFTFIPAGVIPLVEAYQAVLRETEADTIVLIDGGTDSLMRGDECGLGTPQEDYASIAAVDSLRLPTKLLVCLGFGIDTYHGVCHAHFLEAVADLTRRGGFLGAFSLLPDMPEFIAYREAAEFVFRAMPKHPSIVSSSILSAVEGHFGDHHRVKRTAGSRLWVNPLMAMYWSFRLQAVAERCLYLDRLRATQDFADLSSEIWKFRNTLPKIKAWEPIPL
jgi:hypothetical protein